MLIFDYLISTGKFGNFHKIIVNKQASWDLNHHWHHSLQGYTTHCFYKIQLYQIACCSSTSRQYSLVVKILPLKKSLLYIYFCMFINTILIILDSDWEWIILYCDSGDSEVCPYNELLGSLWIVCQSELFVTILKKKWVCTKCFELCYL